MAKLNDELAKVTTEANGLFGKLSEAVAREIKKGSTELDVIEMAKISGLEIDERALAELKIDRIIYVYPWIPWYHWFPWRPLWCWWWHRHYPWYHCCPWWWHRCHWHPYPCF